MINDAEKLSDVTAIDITKQPENITAKIGTIVSFTVEAEGIGYDDAENYGCFSWNVSGQESTVTTAARSPVSKLPSGWQGRVAVISAWVYSDNWSTIDGGMYWRIHLTQGNRTTAFKYNEIQILTSGGAIASGARGDDAVNGKWRRVSAQFAFTDEDMSDGGSGQFDQATHCWVEFVCTQNVQMSLMQPKLEFGNVCTDWSPSPEDADADLVTLNDRISNAEIKMTDDSIISTVTTSETYLNDQKVYQEAIAKNAEDLAGYITSNKAELEVIQNQIDGSISTWFYAAVPTVTNEPASEWTTNTDRDTHLGDLYYNTNTGYCYRWQRTGDTYNWQRIEDTDVTKALSDAAKAKDTADNKRRVFVNQPIPPYDIGDIWTQGANGDIMVAKVSRTSGSYVASDWQKASKYTDDTLAVQNRTSIAQLDERITLSAERVEEIGGEVEGMQSSIDLIPSQITAAVGEMRIGGSNYLKDSSISVTTTANIVGRYYFGNAKPRSGYQHTIRIWGTLASGSTTFRIYVYNSSGTETLFGEATLQDDGTYVKTGNWTVANPSYIQINKYPSNSNTSTITKIKLEEGSVPTDWTPYNEEFRAGSSVVITEEEVNISTSKFGVDIVGSDGETNMLTIDENGASMDSLVAPNVAPRYNGPIDIYVNPNATTTQLASGAYYRSLVEALAVLSNKWIEKSVNVNISSDVTEYGKPTLSGCGGGGWIGIIGNSSGPAKIVGSLIISHCASPVSIKYINVDSAINETAIDIRGGYVDISNCTITGRGVGAEIAGAANDLSAGVRAQQGARVAVSNCQIYNVHRSLYTQTVSMLMAMNNKGNARVGANRSPMFVSGTAPCNETTWAYSTVAGGQVWGAPTVDQGTAASPVTQATEITITANSTGSYVTNEGSTSGGSWRSDRVIRQGYWGDSSSGVVGEYAGCFWFSNSGFAGKTIKSAVLTITRTSGSGSSRDITLHMYGITLTSASGNPHTGKKNYNLTGTIGNGETRSFTVPTNVIQDLANGTIKGFMFYSNDGDSGKKYGANYCKIDSSGSTIPTLKINYV